MDTGTIYGLIDPRTGLLRYVGKTVRPLEQRLLAHCHEPKRSRKSHWVRSLRNVGLTPTIKSISEHPVAELDDMEIATIAWIRSAGGLLLNGTDGGTAGCHFHPYVTKKVSDKLRGRRRSEEQIQKTKEGNKRRRIVDLIHLYAYHKNYGAAASEHAAESVAAYLEKELGLKISDPFPQKVLGAAYDAGYVIVRCPPYYGPDPRPAKPMEKCHLAAG